MIYGAKINRESKDGFNIHTVTEIDGEKKSLQEWVKISGVDRTIIKRRYKKGIRGKALIEPIKRRNIKFVLSDEEAKAIEENFKLVYKGWHHLKEKYPSLDESELYDCCIDAIVYTSRHFDESKGKFSTLFFVNAKSNALKRMDYWNTEKRKGINYSTEFLLGGEDEESFIDRYLGIEDEYEFMDQEIIESIFSVLTKREKVVMYKYIFEEKSKKAIAKELGWYPMAVGREINEAMKKLESRMESCYF